MATSTRGQWGFQHQGGGVRWAPREWAGGGGSCRHWEEGGRGPASRRRKPRMGGGQWGRSVQGLAHATGAGELRDGAEAALAVWGTGPGPAQRRLSSGALGIPGTSCCLQPSPRSEAEGPLGRRVLSRACGSAGPVAGTGPRGMQEPTWLLRPPPQGRTLTCAGDRHPRAPCTLSPWEAEACPGPSGSGQSWMETRSSGPAPW